MALLPASLLASLACLHTAAAQAAAVAPPAPKIFSPNPPACLSEFGNIVSNFADVASGIVANTVQCSTEFGFIGSSIYAPREVWIFHQQHLCANSILQETSKFAEAFQNMLAACFDCFNSNQACGQTISGAIASLLRGFRELESATVNCAPQYATYPYPFNSEVAITGFNCWSNIIKFMQRVLRGAKNIDAALTVCQVVAPQPVKAQPAPVPQQATKGREAAPEQGGGEEESSGWQELTPPEPFAPVGEQIKVEAVERRRLMAGTNASGLVLQSAEESDDLAFMLAELHEMQQQLLALAQQGGALMQAPAAGGQTEAQPEHDEREAAIRRAIRAMAAPRARGGPPAWVSV